MPWPTEPGHRRGQPLAQRLRVLAKHQGICHICGHPGGEEIDHIIGVSEWRRRNLDGSPHRDSNLAPVHGEPCKTCGLRCHRDKTQAEAADARALMPRRHRAPEKHPGSIT